MFKSLLMTTAFVAFAGVAQAQTTLPPAPLPPSASQPMATPAERNARLGMNTTQSANEWRTSKLVGLGVYNSANEKIGNIDDLIIDSKGQVSLAVIGVGGFLSIGTKDVAIDFKSLHMARDANSRPIAKLEMTKEQLKDAPEYVFLKDAATTVAPDAARRPAR